MRVSYEGYLIRNSSQGPNLVDIQVEGKGGKIPVVLQGAYTNVEFAKKAIDLYLVSKEEGRAKTTS